MRVLHDTLRKVFDLDHQFNDPILGKIFYYRLSSSDDEVVKVTFTPETADSAIFGKVYFQKPGTENDIFLNQFDHWDSPIYHHKNKAFVYNTTFAIQLKQIDKANTMLTIKALQPEIYNGTKCCGPCFGNYAIEETVKPTTIEEYTLILYIAKKLGVNNLKPLELPQ